MEAKLLTFILKLSGAGLIVWGIIPPISAFEIVFGVGFLLTGFVGAHVH